MGKNLQSLVLFGSQAQGNAKPDSDDDLLVVLKNVHSYSLRRKILAICYQLCALEKLCEQYAVGKDYFLGLSRLAT